MVLKFQNENYTVWSQRENTAYLKSKQYFENFQGMAGFVLVGAREDKQGEGVTLSLYNKVKVHVEAKFKNVSCRVSIFFTP